MHDISPALVQLPRPFERRLVPEGRKFRRWRQPERLFERPQGASCAEGSDRRNFQAAVTGRLPFLLLRFLSVRHGKKMKGPWNHIPKMETVVCFGYVRHRYVSPHRCMRNVHIENESRTPCSIQVQHWCSFPARWNGGRCPKGENLAGGVSRSACLSEQSERVARRVVTGEIFRPQ